MRRDLFPVGLLQLDRKMGSKAPSYCHVSMCPVVKLQYLCRTVWVVVKR